MLDMLRNKRFPDTMLKHFIFISLCFPLFSSSYGSVYAPDFILANVFAFLTVVGLFVSRGMDFRGNKIWVCLLALLLAYNLSALYANVRQLQWYSSQLNVTIPFLLFLALVTMKDSSMTREDSVVRFLLKVVVISNAIGILFYFLNYYGVGFMNMSLTLIPVDPEYYERRFNWIYHHKSEYAFFLVLFLALIVTYRRLFPKPWMYYASIGVMAVGLVISHTYTSMAAAVLIFAGLMMDRLFGKGRGFRLKSLLWLLPIVAVGLVLLGVVAADRDLMTLGHRLPIWQGAIGVIRENPYGTGRVCGLLPYELSEVGFTIYNCHNVFLNFMLQFSIPAGFFCIAMIGFIALVSLARNLSFTTLGIWAALLIPMNMDWCMLLTSLPMFLLGLYFLFFSPLRSREPVPETAESM